MKKVMVIDDEPGIAELVTWCLDPLGLQVVLADGLSSAISVARNDDIGLVLLDFDLGIEDGLDILPQLRAEPRLRDVPVVGFSAHDSRRDEGFDRGIVSFINRPFAQADLRDIVSSHLALVKQ